MKKQVQSKDQRSPQPAQETGLVPYDPRRSHYYHRAQLSNRGPYGRFGGFPGGFSNSTMPMAQARFAPSYPGPDCDDSSDYYLTPPMPPTYCCPRVSRPGADYYTLPNMGRPAPQTWQAAPRTTVPKVNFDTATVAHRCPARVRYPPTAYRRSSQYAPVRRPLYMNQGHYSGQSGNYCVPQMAKMAHARYSQPMARQGPRVATYSAVRPQRAKKSANKQSKQGGTGGIGGMLKRAWNRLTSG